MITKKQSNNETKGWSWLWYAVLSAVFASLTSILGKIGISEIDSNLGTAIRTIVVLIMAWLMVFVTGKQRKITMVSKRNMLFICLSVLSWLCYFKALQDGQASVGVPIDKLSILITIAFSYFVLKEKLTKKIHDWSCSDDCRNAGAGKIKKYACYGIHAEFTLF